MGIASKMGWEPTLAGRDSAVTAMNLAEWLPAMPRLLLLVTGVVLGLLALLPGAQGQGRPEVAAAVPAPKVRVLAIARTPLADERLPEGGLIVALVSASLGQTGSDGSARPDIDVRWTTPALVRTLLSDPSIDMTLPLNGADCERPNDLSHTSAVLCDQATYSDPILRVVMGLFTPSGSAFKFDTDESILGKRICLAQDYDLSSLNGEGRNWASEQRVVVLRQPTLLDCIVAVQGRKADAFAATDLEGRYLLGRLGLQELFAMGERPLATLSLHAVVSSEHARGPGASKCPEPWPRAAQAEQGLRSHRPEASHGSVACSSGHTGCCRGSCCSCHEIWRRRSTASRRTAGAQHLQDRSTRDAPGGPRAGAQVLEEGRRRAGRGPGCGGPAALRARGRDGPCPSRYGASSHLRRRRADRAKFAKRSAGYHGSQALVRARACPRRKRRGPATAAPGRKVTGRIYSVAEVLDAGLSAPSHRRAQRARTSAP